MVNDLLNNRLALGILVLCGVPAFICGYVLLVERILRPLRPRLAERLRPWLWILPGVAFLSVFLVYPTIATIVRSLHNRRGDGFVGLDNFTWFFSEGAGGLAAMRNNLLWAVALPLLVVGIGLVVAVFADRVRYEVAVRSIIFLPMAISAVAAGVIWRLMYDYNPRVGTINAAIVAAGGEPQSLLTEGPWNNLMLVIVGMWMMTGLAVVVLGSGLKSIPAELIEAARIDGAGEWRVFRNVVYPLLKPTIAVVMTTVLIFALKTFDVVFVMTNGNFGTEVMANMMYRQLFQFTQEGRAAAVAVLLFLCTVPLMVLQIRRFRQQEEMR